MNPSMNKSLSDSDLCLTKEIEKTPPNYVSNERGARIKRKRSEDFSSELFSFKEDIMKNLADLFAKQENKINENFNPTLKDIQATNRNIELSMTFLTEQNKELKEKIELLESQRREDSEYIAILENKIEDMQMSARKPNLELKNVPRKDNETKEDLIEMVLCLSKTVGSDLVKRDIKDIYRVHGKKGGTPNTPIIVETSSTIVKTDILKLCKAFNIKHKAKLCAKHAGLRIHEDTPIFVSENLTSKGSRLYFLARDLVKSKKFKFCWTAYGKVYVRKEENSPVIIIKSESQCQGLMNSKE